jgi:Tfp pilus assembly protein PilF
MRDLEIRSLLNSAEETTDGEQGRAARRVLEMVSVQTAFTQVQHYFSIKDYARAAVCLEVATEITPDNAVAWYNLACAQAQSGATKKALRSVTRAVDEGFANLEQLREDPDLDPLRDRPEFAKLVASLPPG